MRSSNGSARGHAAAHSARLRRSRAASRPPRSPCAYVTTFRLTSLGHLPSVRAHQRLQRLGGAVAAPTTRRCGSSPPSRCLGTQLSAETRCGRAHSGPRPPGEVAWSTSSARRGRARRNARRSLVARTAQAAHERRGCDRGAARRGLEASCGAASGPRLNHCLTPPSEAACCVPRRRRAAARCVAAEAPVRRASAARAACNAAHVRGQSSALVGKA